MNETATEFGQIAGLGLAIFIIIISIVITKAVFEIPKRRRLLQAQLYLLGKIAEKHGVPKEEIRAAKDFVEGEKTVLI